MFVFPSSANSLKLFLKLPVCEHKKREKASGNGAFTDVTERRVYLTLMPSNRDSALSGLSALSVRRDLMAAKSEYPSVFATRLTRDTYE